MPFSHVAIIGAGLCGLSLAVVLQQKGIKTVLFEARPEGSASTPGAITLAPNGLRSLDSMGIYDRVKSKGYHFRDGFFRKNDHEIFDTYEIGHADRHGYEGFRIHRQILLDDLRAMACEAGVQIHYGKKFSHIVREDDSGVRFAFSDGEEHRADLMIGADGIHSAVRRYLYPHVQTVFSNVMTIITDVPTSAVRFPFQPYGLPTSLHASSGAIFLAPQGAHGEDLLLAVQRRTHERDRAGWDVLLNDKQYLLGLMKHNYDEWNDTARSALDAIRPEDIFLWAFYSVPKLEKWGSQAGKVVILGDAAHAIPPAAGQGINQGFEDVHAFSLLLIAAKDNKALNWNDCLQWWQQYRQKRVDRATDLTNEMTVRRTDGWDGEGVQSIDNTALYNVQVAEDVREWLAKI